jgi:hypothetical protein
MSKSLKKCIGVVYSLTFFMVARKLYFFLFAADLIFVFKRVFFAFLTNTITETEDLENTF